MAKVTQHEIAAKLGVSRSTVAAALNPGSTIRLNEATRQRIVAAARELNYRPDRYARIMRGGRSGLVGILHFGGLLQVAAERAAHAAAAVRKEGFEVVASDLSWSSESIQTACTSLLDARVEGAIVAGMVGDASAIEALERLRHAAVPIVTLSGNPLPWGPHFRGDTRQATRDLTRHLIATGHRRIGLLIHYPSDPHDRVYLWSSLEKRRGFEEALAEAGGSLVSRFRKGKGSPQGVITEVRLAGEPFDPFLPGIEGMLAVLKRPDRPTALLCSNDEFAYGALSVCRERGIAVPQEIAMTGYDDTALGRYAPVPLTTVRQPNQAMAEAAVKALLRLIEQGNCAPLPETTLFPCEILLRGSSVR
ncbi:MAG TPA: LacI family DNA-binding transcriptional regulator [Chthoniobacteraceae bacterium]|nr:LacI family DNA-binding transcriptional regulator [Chthoniobacteraceae bacterium]